MSEVVSEAPFAPQDRLSVWWLGDPAQPKRVGEAQLVQGGRSVALRYADTWLAQGFALSEDLPLTRELFVPREKDSAAGALDDARPDRWGERLIRKFQPTPRLSLLEYLLFAGDDRYGGLGLRLDEDRYRPWHTPPLPGFAELGAMAEVVRQVLAGEPVPQPLQRLLRPGASLGGAQPKSLLQMEGRTWLLKFNEEVEGDMGLTEHAAMRLAAACGIEVATTRALPLTAADTGKPPPTPWRSSASTARVPCGFRPCLRMSHCVRPAMYRAIPISRNCYGACSRRPTSPLHRASYSDGWSSTS